jgi:hypothetical protein
VGTRRRADSPHIELVDRLALIKSIEPVERIESIECIEWAAGNREIAQSGGRTLVVSRGVGMERGSAPRLRFRCQPEVVVIELVPAR